MIRRSLLVCALALLTLVGAVSPALAWNPPGTYTFEGNLTSTLALPGAPSLNCDVSFTADLDNGSVNTGEVTASSITNCVTTVPGCDVEVMGDHTPPWAIDGTNTGGGSGPVTIEDVKFTVTYFNAPGETCPVGSDGCSFDVIGADPTPDLPDVTGDYDANTGTVTFPTGGDDLVVANSTCTNVPNGTAVDITGTVTVQGATVPVLV